MPYTRNFGQYAEIYNPNNQHYNSLAPRTQAGISLNGTGNLTGSVNFYIFDNKRIVSRDQFKLLPMPENVKGMLNSMHIADEKYELGKPVTNLTFKDEIVPSTQTIDPRLVAEKWETGNPSPEMDVESSDSVNFPNQRDKDDHLAYDDLNLSSLHNFDVANQSSSTLDYFQQSNKNVLSDTLKKSKNRDLQLNSVVRDTDDSLQCDNPKVLDN